MDEYNKVIAESRLMKDELDILREKAAKVSDLEDRIRVI